MAGNPYEYQGPGLHDILGFVNAKRQQDQDAENHADRLFNQRLSLEQASREAERAKDAHTQAKLTQTKEEQGLEDMARVTAKLHGDDVASRVLQTYHGAGHGIKSNPDGTYYRYGGKFGGDNLRPNEGTLGIDTAGDSTARLAQSLTPMRAPYSSGGSQAAPAPGSLLSGHDLETVQALQDAGAHPEIVARFAKEKMAARAQAADPGDLFNNSSTPMSSDIASMQAAARAIPQRTAMEENIQRAIDSGLTKPESIIDDMRNKAVTEEAMQHNLEIQRHNMAMEARRRGVGGGMNKADARDEKEAFAEVMKINARLAGKELKTEWTSDANGQLSQGHKIVDSAPPPENERKALEARKQQLHGRLSNIAKKRGESFDPDSVPTFTAPKKAAPPMSADAKENAINVLSRGQKSYKDLEDDPDITDADKAEIMQAAHKRSGGKVPLATVGGGLPPMPGAAPPPPSGYITPDVMNLLNRKR